MTDRNAAFMHGFNMMMQMYGMRQQKDQAELKAKRDQETLDQNAQILKLKKDKATREEKAFKEELELKQLEKVQAQKKAESMNAFFKPGQQIAPNLAAGMGGQFSIDPRIMDMAKGLMQPSPAQQAYGPNSDVVKQIMNMGGTPPDPSKFGKPPTPETPSQLDVGKYASQLRKEFDASKVVKDYNEINFRYGVMKEAMAESKKTQNFVAVDQAVITTFNKMTDPDSVVRESEYIRTSSDLGIWNRLKGKIAKLRAGGAGLTQSDREALFKMAEKFMAVAKSKYQTQKQRYTGFFRESGLDPQKHFYSGLETQSTTSKITPPKDISKMSDEELAEELAKMQGKL